MENSGEMNLKEYIQHLTQEFLPRQKLSDATQTIEALMVWPPDVFAITSLILKQTGAYSFSILPLEAWPDKYWLRRLDAARKQWYRWILDPARNWDVIDAPIGDLSAVANEDPEHAATLRASLSTALRDFVQALPDALLEEVSIEEIQRLVDESPELYFYPDSAHNLIEGEIANDDYAKWQAWQVCKAVLDLHALADEICRGFGTPSGTQWVKGQEAGNVKPIHCIANMLLALNGTLSQLPRHEGVVLPKMRTPEVGMTLRNLSHHLTFHVTEVQVEWRTLPWVDIDDNTVNLLIVPWPYAIKPTWFRPSSWTTNRKGPEQTRFFEYTGGGGENRFRYEYLEEMLKDAEQSVNRVHLIVFPELALTGKELDEILEKLALRSSADGAPSRTQIPMVLAGIRSDDSHDPMANHSSRIFPTGSNRVVLSTFFAGKWYQIEQNKHHRWKLNATQIQQYGLGGALAASRHWWEAIPITRRKLSVLAPNSWFTLCPLICEDLARQEPISDLIRGIGPTMLIAILMDGPQLRERWAGRYASVLADDPGTSVLSVSPLGFTQRSMSSSGESGSPQVGLWKDSETGYTDIRMNAEMGGVLLTVDARSRTELTSDGRTDLGNAAAFARAGVQPLPLDAQRFAKSEDGKGDGGASGEDGKVSVKGSSVDLLEVTLFSFLVDAVLDCDTTGNAKIDWISELQHWLLGREVSKTSPLANLKQVHRVFARRALELFGDPSSFYIQKEHNRMDVDNLKPFIAWFCDLMRCIRPEDGEPVSKYRLMIEYTEAILGVIKDDKSFTAKVRDGEDPFAGLRKKYKLPETIHPKELLNPGDWQIRIRIAIYICLSILWGVHRRLVIDRRVGDLSGEESNLLYRIEQILQHNYDQVWLSARDLAMSSHE
jgi:hypothetical protein